MLRIAQAKPGAGRVRFTVADLRRLPDLGEFDVAVALGEPFDYLRNEEELGSALRGAANLLAPGGLLVFDINTRGLPFVVLLRPSHGVAPSQVMFVLIGGVIAERRSRGALLAVTDLLNFAAYATMAAMFLAGHVSILALAILAALSRLATLSLGSMEKAHTRAAPGWRDLRTDGVSSVPVNGFGSSCCNTLWSWRRRTPPLSYWASSRHSATWAGRRRGR
ncbi:class I SAM-dependent methyltransferase [Actinoallomurus iriomotensis]|uniref:Methyltransferase domain-containing protein n=1 Tax=Actinoallomurus iriomotensis TaxID=478107 RepID=A0A9W6RE61_9ACTN|nr:class I SAM-dependent methyltransferase [Actinoallomurus iriomotensis]GLY74133.1 hypothetical protein Airi01_024000 [Actinoallomurus iriomotensis]